MRLKQATEIQDHAKAELLNIAKELRLMNESTAASLLEGLEEVLMLQRQGLMDELGPRFKTTNVIESVHAGGGQRTDTVGHWRNSNQLHRWHASSRLGHPGVNRWDMEDS